MRTQSIIKNFFEAFKTNFFKKEKVELLSFIQQDYCNINANNMYCNEIYLFI